MRRAFVSHSSSDDTFVEEMESFLRNGSGFDKVFDDISAIKPNEKFWLEIEEGIKNRETFIVVTTVASEGVEREVEFAVASRRRTSRSGRGVQRIPWRKNGSTRTQARYCTESHHRLVANRCGPTCIELTRRVRQ